MRAYSLTSIIPALKKTVVALAAVSLVSVSCAKAATADTGTTNADGDGKIEKREFLQVRGTELYLNGKPFYEISFNKFDLFWQLLAGEQGVGGFGKTPVKRAEKSLKELHEFGFKTIRVFCATVSMENDYFTVANRPKFHAAMDRMLGLCDQYDLRVVFCLATANNLRAPGESTWDVVADPDSKSRQRVYEFVDDMVTRYHHRKTIAMWEIANELLLESDIGGRNQMWGDHKVPNLAEIAQYHADIATFISRIDNHHPITTGDSYRNSLWHLSEYAKGNIKEQWKVDTLEQMTEAVSRAQKPVDVFCVHNYYAGKPYGVHSVRQADGNLAPMKLADWTRTAQALGMPMYIGEYGVLPRARTAANQKQFQHNPDWPVSFEQEPKQSVTVIRDALQLVLDGKPNLTHWWCYQSDRDMDQKNPQRFDMDLDRTPELVSQIVEANRNLQMETMGFTYMRDSDE